MKSTGDSRFGCPASVFFRFVGMVLISLISVPRAYSSFVVDGTTEKDVRDVRVIGSLGYASIGSGLLILDVSNPANPVVLSQLDLAPARPPQIQGHFRVVYRGGLAWVPMWADGVYGVDVTDPVLPVLRFHIPTPHDVREIALYGDYLYAGTHDTGLMIYDIVDPGSPQMVGITPQSRLTVRDLAVSGSILYAAAFRVYAYDLTDPTMPELVDIVIEAGRASSIRTRGSLAFITDNTLPGFGPINGMAILDISDPFDPYVVGYEAAHGNDEDVITDGAVAYVANPTLGLHAVDVSRSDSPYVLSWVYQGSLTSESLIKHGAFIYLSARDGGLWVIPLNPRGDGNTDGAINAEDVILLVNYVFKSGPEPTPPQGQVDCVGGVTTADIIYLINYVFKSGPTPACP